MHHHLHRHEPGDAKTGHYRQQRQQRVLLGALVLTLGFSIVEAIGGWLANSLALISDAGHMSTDAIALGLAWLAQTIARRPPSTKHSFGFGRTEALTAFINGLFMLAVIIWIVVEAIQRLYTPPIVKADTIIWIAIMGLFINILVAWILSRDNTSVNSRAALLHVWGDLLGSIAALGAGIGIHYTGWTPLDPILSLLVSLLILQSTWRILRETYHFLMKGVPYHIDYEGVGINLNKIDGVVSVHDLHIWDMTPGETALIGHIVINDMYQWPQMLENIRTMLRNKYAIDHITLQPEPYRTTTDATTLHADEISTQLGECTLLKKTDIHKQNCT